MPIFSCGAVIGMPSSSTRPWLGRVEAADRAQQSGLAAAGAADDGDDLAQTDGKAHPAERLHAVGIGLADLFEHQHGQLSSCRPKRSSQRRNGAAIERDDPVGGLAQHGKGQDRRDDLGGFAELLAVDQQIAEAFGRAHELGGDHEHPAQAEPRAQRDHIGRQHRRQQDAPHHGEAGQPEHASDFDDLAVDRQDGAHHAEIDREEHADGDERDLGGLENSQPQDEQRNPGDRGNRAQRLQARIDQPARHGRIAGDRAQNGRHRGAERKSDNDAQQRRNHVPPQLAGARQFGEFLEDARGRRHQAAGGQTGAHRQLPADGQRQAAAAIPTPDAPAATRSRAACRRLGSARPLRSWAQETLKRSRKARRDTVKRRGAAGGRRPLMQGGGPFSSSR